MDAELKELIGKTLKSVTQEGGEILFVTSDGFEYKLMHEQDCCESVSIDDICGDLEDLVGAPILMAEEVSNEEFVKSFEGQFNFENEYGSKVDKDGNYAPESCTWTFYKFATLKGYVNIRWYGESNGYYSEGVSFLKKNPDGTFGWYYED